MWKYLISSIKKNKFISIIFIFQIIIGIWGLAQISYYSDYSKIYEKNAENLNVEQSEMYSVKSRGGIFKFNENNKFIEDIERELGEETIGISIETILELENDSNKMVRNLKVSKSILDIMDLNIIEGRNLNENDLKRKNTTPAIISEELDSIFKIGDRIQTQYGSDREEFEIIGFFEKGTKWFTTDFIFAEFRNLKDVIVSPYYYDEDNNHNVNLFNSLYLFNNGKNQMEFETLMDKIISENNLFIEIQSVAEQVKLIKSKNEDLIKSFTIIATIVISFTLFSIGMVVFYSTKYSKKDIGILKVVGMKSKNIKIILMIEWMIYMLVALFISLIIIYFNEKNSEFIVDGVESLLSLATISYTDVFKFWMIFLILVLIIVYIATKKVINKEISELLKGGISLK
ncbi:MAG: FtsX-like permease family protein [Sarcina sp.]